MSKVTLANVMNVFNGSVGHTYHDMKLLMSRLQDLGLSNGKALELAFIFSHNYHRIIGKGEDRKAFKQQVKNCLD